MQSHWINQLSSWNPQLLRELRGQIKTRNVLAAIGLSAIVQLLLLLLNWQPNWSESPQDHWARMWSILTWALPYLLFVLGSYYIVADITQEEKRGTLNFIRLSPRPGWQILLGKLIGVPILPFLMTVSLIPLHLWTALGAKISFFFMLSYYLVLGAGVVLCYSLAMLYGLTGSSQKALMGRQGSTSISFSAIAFFIFSPLFMAWNTAVTWQGLGNAGPLAQEGSSLMWAYLPIGSNPVLAHGFTFVNIAIALALTWRILLRRFRQPRSTLMSKRQSYALLAYIEILMVGFTIIDSTNANWQPSGVIVAMAIISVIMVFLLIFAIVPQRQALIEWSRYSNRGIQNWLWADKSPMLLASLIHIGMVFGLLLPWVFLLDNGWQYPLETVIMFAGIATTLLICGVFVQSVMAGRTRNPFVWAAGSLTIWLVVPPIILGVLRLTPDKVVTSAALWTFFGYPFLGLESNTALVFTAVGLVFQWILLGMLLWRCNRILKQLRVS